MDYHIPLESLVEMNRPNACLCNECERQISSVPIYEASLDALSDIARSV